MPESSESQVGIVRFRWLNERDARVAAAMEQDMAWATGETLDPDHGMMSYDAEAWAGQLVNRRGFALGAFVDGKLCGILCTRRNTTGSRRFVRIMRLTVANEFQRRGVGTKLVSRLIQQTDPGVVIICSAARDLVGFGDFLRKNGFRCEGIDRSRASATYSLTTADSR